MKLHPQGIKGSWKAGIVLDWHTVGSQISGQNELGYPIFDNFRSEIGEKLYQFKYKNDQGALGVILHASIDHLWSNRGKFDLIIPVPPSSSSSMVTKKLAQGLAEGLSTSFSDTALLKIKSTNAVKGVSDPEIRKSMLTGVFQADAEQLNGRSVLLVDDIYRSGATLESATEVILAQGQAKTVYVLAITRTRVHR
jgi:predicted amidophosphoribosyltransferase